MMHKTKVIKQDINFLDKPIWFQNIRHDGLGSVWIDVEGYEYRTGYKLPDKVDMLFLLCMLQKAQNLEYQNKITTSRYEILKICGLCGKRPEYYYPRLEDSLKRWKNISIEFHGTFYNGQHYSTIGFGIIDDYQIDKINKHLIVKFNENWLLKIKESTFFKYINFEYYKALKRPGTRRLYELLCKTFKGRDTWSIGLVKLGNKLTLSPRTVLTKSGTKHVMYASDVLVAVKPAINELNKLAAIPDITEKTGILTDDLFTVDHFITGNGQDRIINFKRKSVAVPKSKPKEKVLPESVQVLLNFIPSEHREKKTIIIAIQKSQKKHGNDYIQSNIDYTNQHAKINYRAYLLKALKENYAEECINSQAETDQKKKTEIERALQEFKAYDLATLKTFAESGNIYAIEELKSR